MREIEGLAKLDTDTWMAAAPLTLSPDRDKDCWVNDTTAGVNPARVLRVMEPANLHEVRRIVRQTRANGGTLSVAGGRSSAGGTSFATGAVLMSTAGLSRLLELDLGERVIEAEAGTRWSTVRGELEAHGAYDLSKLQTARTATIGGSLGRNVLDGEPIAEDVLSMTFVDPFGQIRSVDTSDPTFHHLLGGLGLFGVVYSVRMRIPQRGSEWEAARGDRASDEIPLPGTALNVDLVVPRDRSAALQERVEHVLTQHAIRPRRARVKTPRVGTKCALPWSTQPSALLSIELPVSSNDIDAVQNAARDLCDTALASGGRFLLGTQPFATRDQTRRAYELDAFRSEKLRIDPEEVFTNEWYRTVTAGT